MQSPFVFHLIVMMTFESDRVIVVFFDQKTHWAINIKDDEIRHESNNFIKIIKTCQTCINF